MPILKLSKIDTFSREVTLPFSFVRPFQIGATLTEMYSLIHNSKNLLPQVQIPSIKAHSESVRKQISAEAEARERGQRYTITVLHMNRLNKTKSPIFICLMCSLLSEDLFFRTYFTLF